MFSPPCEISPIRVSFFIPSVFSFHIKLWNKTFSSFNCYRAKLGSTVNRWISFGSARVFITVILPSNVNFLCYQLLSIAETSFTFLAIFILTILVMSKKESIPRSLKSAWDHRSLKSGQMTWSEYFFSPIHTALVLEKFIFKPDIYVNLLKHLRVSSN